MTLVSTRSVVQLPLEPGLVCLRGLCPKHLRFEGEYGLERGKMAKIFLFLSVIVESEQTVSAAALLVAPRGLLHRALPQVAHSPGAQQHRAAGGCQPRQPQPYCPAA